MNTELPEKCSKKALKEAVEAFVAEFDKSIAEGEVAIKSANAVPYAVMTDGAVSDMLLGDFFTEWLTYIKPNVARTTHLCYRKISDRYMEYINENYPNLTLGQLKWNQGKEIKKRVILVEKMVEKKWHSRLYFLPTIIGNIVKSGISEKNCSQGSLQSRTY